MKPITVYLNKKEVILAIVFGIIGLGSSIAMVVFAPVENGVKGLIIVAIALLLVVVFVAAIGLGRSRLVIEEDKVTLYRSKRVIEIPMADIEYVSQEGGRKGDIVIKVKDKELPYRLPYSMPLLEAFYKVHLLQIQNNEDMH